jgi:hypothetical protein
MARLPAYLKLAPIPGAKGVAFSLKIKRWGLPILIFQVMRECFDFPWYYWLAYPYLCFKAMFVWEGDADGDIPG